MHVHEPPTQSAAVRYTDVVEKRGHDLGWASPETRSESRRSDAEQSRQRSADQHSHGYGMRVSGASCSTQGRGRVTTGFAWGLLRLTPDLDDHLPRCNLVHLDLECASHWERSR